jgi:hypothetical protein
VTPAYAAWNEALTERLIPVASSTPIYLFTDAGLIEDLASEIGVDPVRAVDEFVAAVRVTLDGHRPFERWERVSRDPVDANETPQYIAVLCFMVLIAVDRERTRFSYYPELNKVLGRPTDAGAPSGFDRDVRLLFTRFNEWLKSSGRGVPTATTSPSYPNVSWPLSQALVRPADRTLLARLFTAAGLSRGIDPSRNKLLSTVNPRLVTAASSPSRTRLLELREGHANLFVEILEREFRNWDGGISATSSATSFVRLCFEEETEEWWFLGAGAAVGDGASWRLGSASGRARGARGFEAMPPEIGQLLGSGVVGEIADGPRLVSKPRALRWMTLDRRVGGWAEVGLRDPEIDQLLVTRSNAPFRPSTVSGVEHLKAELADHEVFIVPRGVDVSADPAVPRHVARFVGGLPLDGRTNTYLCRDHLPALEVPESAVEVRFNGTLVEAETSMRVGLGGLGLGSGDHDFQVGQQRVKLRLVDRVQFGPTALQDTLSWHADLTSSARVRIPHDRGPVWLVGADGDLVQKEVPQVPWVKSLGLLTSEADVTGLVASLGWPARFVVNANYAGRPWVASVPLVLADQHGQNVPAFELQSARSMVHAVLGLDVGLCGDELRSWRRALAAVMRRTQR